MLMMLMLIMLISVGGARLQSEDDPDYNQTADIVVLDVPKRGCFQNHQRLPQSVGCLATLQNPTQPSSPE